MFGMNELLVQAIVGLTGMGLKRVDFGFIGGENN